MSNETNNVGFDDPLDEILDRAKSQKTNIVTPQIAEPSLPEQPEIRRVDPPVINYGDDDLDAENARIDQMIADEKIKKAEEAQRVHDENKGVPILPTPTTNPDAYAEEVNFQGNVLAIVTKMVKQVVSDYGLNSGGIPEEDPDNLDQFGNPTRIKQHVMGNLVAEYHMNGEIITPRFVSEILDNWIMADGTPARVFIENRDNPNNNTTSPTTIENKNDINDDVDETDTDDNKANPSININVYNADDAPINVNVDSSLINSIAEEKVVDVYVKRVTQHEMLSSKVIENCKTPGIIKPYDPGLSDIPVTLPVSGYRAILSPMSFLEVLTYVQPAARTAADFIYKQWSIIHKHIKWTSIGTFKDFNDFMEKTRIVDQEYLMWAILVATTTEKESLIIRCKNPDCHHDHKMVYTPRNIIKIDPELVPEYYNDADTAAPGDEAIKVFNEKALTKTLYRMPKSGILIEFETPSVADFINYRYPHMRKAYNEFYHDDDFDKNFPGIMELLSSTKDDLDVFTFKLAIAMTVSSVSVPKTEEFVSNGVKTVETVDYKYTDWDSIIDIITSSLTYEESFLLFTELIPKCAKFQSPVSFELESFKCEKCGCINDIHISSIAGELLFPKSRTLMNTKVNLIEQPKNF